MPSRKSRRKDQGPILIATVYLMASSIWIAATDRLLRHISSDPDFLTRAAIAKGFLFIFVTTGLLYVLIRRLNRTQRELHDTVAARTDALADSEAQYRLLFDKQPLADVGL